MARKSFKAGALTAPLPPVLVTVGTKEKYNVLTVAWTGILATIPPRTYVSIRPQRYSHALLSESGEFVINLPTAAMAREVDYIGIYTGAKVDKFKECGITAVPSESVAPPTVGECPVALECRVCEVMHMGTHDVFIADIVGITADESIIDGSGKIRFDRADLLAYAHGEYFALGEKLGEFGFSTKKTKPKARAKAGGVSDKRASVSRKNGEKAMPVSSGEDKEKRPFYLDIPRGKGKRGRGGKKK
ncbi:MAG: flavin reductase family protein [Clostridia bacterium]|nr:flavin reductase family protein [Clostridia bacterium]